MKTVCQAFCILFLVIHLAGCQTTALVEKKPNGITQVATIEALSAGAYDGNVPLAELRKHGDFGLGTFDKLDGEMVLLNGTFHQGRVDGRSYTPPAECLTPFACVTFFQLDKMEVLRSPMPKQAVQDKIDSMIPDTNIICAIKIRGTFSRLKTRSVAAQEKPYPVLAEVIKTQTVFDHENIAGTLVGFRTPPYLKTLNAAGYHFHFISDDKSTGGHVLEFELAKGELEIDSDHEYYNVLLPSGLEQPARLMNDGGGY